MSVNDASALEETLERLRQRYTLYFSLPEGVQPGEERNITVELAPEARRRFEDAEVRYRRAFQSGGSQSGNGGHEDTLPHITRAPSNSGSQATTSSSSTDSDSTTSHRRRVAVNEDGTAISPSGPQQ